MEAYKLLPLGSEWQLKKSGQNEPVGRYADKQQAFREAITLANRHGAKLVGAAAPLTAEGAARR